jgi:hypothetical protein
MKSVLTRVPKNMYDYFKQRQTKTNGRSMTTDMSLFFEKFQRLRSLEKKLEGSKKVLVFK